MYTLQVGRIAKANTCVGTISFLAFGLIICHLSAMTTTTTTTMTMTLLMAIGYPAVIPIKVTQMQGGGGGWRCQFSSTDQEGKVGAEPLAPMTYILGTNSIDLKSASGVFTPIYLQLPFPLIPNYLPPLGFICSVQCRKQLTMFLQITVDGFELRISYAEASD